MDPGPSDELVPDLTTRDIVIILDMCNIVIMPVQTCIEP